MSVELPKDSHLSQTINPSKEINDRKLAIDVPSLLHQETSTPNPLKEHSFKEVPLDQRTTRAISAVFGRSKAQITEEMKEFKEIGSKRFELNEHSFRVLTDAVQDDPFKGSMRFTSAAYLYDDLESFLGHYREKLDENSLIEVLNYQRLFSEFAILDHKLTFDDYDLPKFALETEQKIIHLNENESILLPGGFKNHAAVYKITRKENDRYSFEIYNTGSGTDTSILESSGKQKTNVICYEGTLKDVSNPDFIKELFSHRRHAESMEPSHECINKNFKSRILGRKIPIQQRGICTFSSLMAVLQVALPKEVFEAFQLHSTRTYAKKIEELGTVGLSQLARLYDGTLQMRERKFREKYADKSTPLGMHIFSKKFQKIPLELSLPGIRTCLFKAILKAEIENPKELKLLSMLIEKINFVLENVNHSIEDEEAIFEILKISPDLQTYYHVFCTSEDFPNSPDFDLPTATKLVQDLADIVNDDDEKHPIEIRLAAKQLLDNKKFKEVRPLLAPLPLEFQTAPLDLTTDLILRPEMKSKDIQKWAFTSFKSSFNLSEYAELQRPEAFNQLLKELDSTLSIKDDQAARIYEHLKTLQRSDSGLNPSELKKVREMAIFCFNIEGNDYLPQSPSGRATSIRIIRTLMNYMLQLKRTGRNQSVLPEAMELIKQSCKDPIIKKELLKIAIKYPNFKEIITEATQYP